MKTHSRGRAVETPRVVARNDQRLTARMVRSWALHYTVGADHGLDRPGHVRAGSSLAWVGPRLAVVQDDANFVALVDPTDGSAVAMVLPAGAGGKRQFDKRRGNKAAKLDLEALVSVPQSDGSPLLVAFGSGSTRRRESIVRLRGFDPPTDAIVELCAAPVLYAALRRATAFAGSELNVEGAVFLGESIRLFNRGNGAVRTDQQPVDATGDLEWRALAEHLDHPDHVAPPPLTNVVQYELGTLGGVPLTFTDATLGPNHVDGTEQRILYAAAAEASPDATRDGAVTGSAVGVIVESPLGITARWTILRDARGAPFVGKIEGIAPHQGDRNRAYVVVDRDEFDTPSELCEIALEGDWFDLLSQTPNSSVAGSRLPVPDALDTREQSSSNRDS